MTRRHACAARSLLGFALAASILALAGTASADPTGRIYIKTTNALGKNLATFSVDPNGNLFTASGATYFTGVPAFLMMKPPIGRPPTPVK